jgi:hypothetical protein
MESSTQVTRSNPHGIVETNFQCCFSINVWCSMITDEWNGPIILDDHMTRHNYPDFLQNGLPEETEYVPLATWIAMYFQHEGALSHYTQLVMQHLNDIFPNWWIGCGSTFNWPPRSTDLTSLDFYSMGLDEE